MLGQNKMLNRSKILGLLALLLCGTCSRAEVELTFQCSFGDTSTVFPVLISLRDKDGSPIEGAVVALKRIGPDGWTEEAIVREADKRTDKNGMILLMYPSKSTRTSLGEQSVDIYGAVTVVAKGHRTVSIELRQHFKDGVHVLSEATVPHLKLELTDQPEDQRKQESKAQQAAPEQLLPALKFR